MALNFPGPQEIRILYNCNGLDHVMKLNCIITPPLTPGMAFSSYQVQTRGGTDKALDVAVDEFVALIQARYDDENASISSAELWTYEDLSFDASFLSTYPIGENGTATQTTVLAQSEIYTFRTLEGGIMKLYLMETVSPSNTVIRPPIPAGSIADIADYIISSGNWILGRDTSYPFSILGFLPGQNEKLYKIRYR